MGAYLKILNLEFSETSTSGRITMIFELHLLCFLSFQYEFKSNNSETDFEFFVEFKIE